MLVPGKNKKKEELTKQLQDMYDVVVSDALPVTKFVLSRIAHVLGLHHTEGEGETTNKQ